MNPIFGIFGGEVHGLSDVPRLLVGGMKRTDVHRIIILIFDSQTRIISIDHAHVSHGRVLHPASLGREDTSHGGFGIRIRKRMRAIVERRYGCRRRSVRSALKARGFGSEENKEDEEQEDEDVSGVGSSEKEEMREG